VFIVILFSLLSPYPGVDISIRLLTKVLLTVIIIVVVGLLTYRLAKDIYGFFN